MTGTSAQDATSVAADISDPSPFFQAFAAALQRQAAYPDGHPLLRQAVARVHEQLDGLLAGRDAVLVGVTPDRLLLDDSPIVQEGPSMRELARRLHRRDVGAIRVTPGADVDELGALLRAIALRDERDGTDGSAPANVRQIALPHVQLFPLNYGGLALAEPESADDVPAGDGNLWERLVHLAVGPHDPAGDHLSEQLALALRERLREPLLEAECAAEITRLLAAAATGASLRGRASAVIAVLEPDDLQRLVAAQPDADARRALMRHAARALSAAGLLALTRAAARSGDLPASDATLILMEKLATLAGTSTGRGRGRADAALRRHVEEMVASVDTTSAAGATVRDPAAALAPLLISDEWARPSAPVPPWAERLVRLGLEIDAPVPSVMAAIEVLGARDEGSLAAMAESAPVENSVGAHIRARAFSEAALSSLLTTASEHEEALGQVAQGIGPQVVPTLVDSLLSATSRLERYRIGRALSEFGELAVAELSQRMAGGSRQLIRTALAFLTHARMIPDPASIARYVRHPDAGVRGAAVRLLLSMPDTQEAAALDAIRSGDGHLIRLAARHFALVGTPPAALDPLVQLLGDQDQPSAVRALAIRALPPTRNADVLEALLSLVATRARLTRRPRLAPLTPHVVAALHALARGWSDDPRVRDVLDLALEAGALKPVRRASAAGAVSTSPAAAAGSTVHAVAGEGRRS